MGNFNRGGDRDRRPRPEMHSAVCDECGAKCEVPFQPTPGKPIYCNNCFSPKERSGGDRRPERSFGGDRGDRQMHSAICADCGAKCEVPFRPTGDKPVLCSNCFGKGGSDSRSERRGPVSGGNNSQLEKQLLAMNKKLDEVLQVLTEVKPKVFVPEVKPVISKAAEIKAKAESKPLPKKKEVKKAVKVTKPKKAKK